MAQSKYTLAEKKRLKTNELISLVAINALIALFYAASGTFGLWLGGFIDGNVSLFWPPTGLALAAAFLFGFRVLPGLAVGALIATLSTGAPVGFALVTAFGNPLPALVTYAVFARISPNFQGAITSTRDAILLILVGGLATPILSAGCGVLGLWGNGMIPLAAVPAVFQSWYIGDAVGAIVLGPVLILLREFSIFDFIKSRPRETVTFNLAVICFCSLVIYNWSTYSQVLLISAFPIIVWASLRFSPLVSVGSTLIINGFAIASLIDGLRAGVLAGETPILETQLFIATLSATGLILSTTALERAKAYRRLRFAYGELERFAEVTAHHLQEPVRHQLIYSDMVMKGARDGSDGTSQNDLLSAIHQSAKRQRSLIHAIQTYLSIQVDQDATGTAVPLECLQTARARVFPETRAETVSVSGETTHAVKIDPVLLTTVFEILFQNAKEAALPDTPLAVSVTGSQHAGVLTLAVTDTGHGLDPAFHDRVFDVFEKIDRAQDDDKLGMGLAIARKIIEQAGGEIWLHSPPQGGLSVGFTIRLA